MLSESSRSFQPCSVAGPLPSRPTQATPPTAVLTAWGRWISQRFVPLNRSQWRYFLKRCYQEGKSKALIARYVGTRTGLQTERSYTARILPRGILKGLGDTFLHADIFGLVRAGAIIAGLATTAAGYLAPKPRMSKTSTIKADSATIVAQEGVKAADIAVEQDGHSLSGHP